MNHVKEILCGLAIFLAFVGLLVAIFGTAYVTSHENNVKQQKMNELCVAHGYSGWQSGTNQSHDYGQSGCYK